MLARIKNNGRRSRLSGFVYQRVMQKLRPEKVEAWKSKRFILGGEPLISAPKVPSSRRWFRLSQPVNLLMTLALIRLSTDPVVSISLGLSGAPARSKVSQ